MSFGRRATQMWPLWLALPALLYLAALYALPLGRVLTESFENGGASYAQVLGGDIYWSVYALTFRTALIVTAIDLLLACPVAMFLARISGRWQVIGLFIVLLPFWMSTLVRTYSWMIILGRRGILNEALLATGVIDEPLRLIGTHGAVVTGMVHVLLPFMILPLYASMRQIDRNLENAAAGLGARWWRILLEIYIPLSVHGVIAGVTLVFVLSLGFFISPALLGGGRVPLVAMILEQQVSQLVDWPLASALAVVLLLMALGVVGLLNGLGQWLGGSPR